MSQTNATRASDWVLPPNVDVNGNPNCIAVATSTSVVAVDLASLPLPHNFYDTHIAAAEPNPLGRYVNFQAQNADAFVMFGPTFASVTGANAPVAGTTNTVNGSTGVVTMAKAVCAWIPQGQTLSVLLPAGPTAGVAYGASSPHRFVAAVTSTGAGILRIWQSSP